MRITLIMMNMKRITSNNHKRILMKENKMAKKLININNNSKMYKNNKEVKNNRLYLKNKIKVHQDKINKY